jgi:hypothetical protein
LSHLQRQPLGVVLIVCLLSRGLVMVFARLVERRRRRNHADERRGHDAHSGRGGGDGSELVLAA